jgi:hypothetical protein
VKDERVAALRLIRGPPADAREALARRWRSASIVFAVAKCATGIAAMS